MTVTGWRVARRRYCEPPHGPFDGVGASIHGGRWNSPKVLAAYASSTLSLATLEYLAHIDRSDAPTDTIRVSIEFEAMDVEVLARPYPPGWDNVSPSAEARAFGDRWIRERRSLALEVPSVLVPGEKNFVINANHPRFDAKNISSLVDYPLDQRLL